MKEVLKMLVLAVFLLIGNACTEASISIGGEGAGGSDPTEQGVPLNVKNLGLSVEVESRSIVTGGPVSGAANPNPLIEVGLCVTKRSNSGVVGLYAGGRNKLLYTYNTAASPAAWEPSAGEEPLMLYSDIGTVYGFWPAEKSVSLSGNPKVPVMSSVRVLDKQKFYFHDGGNPVDIPADVQWDTDQDDFLYGVAPQPVDRWAPEVSLSLRHALAKVSFRILEANTGMELVGCGVSKVVLKSSGGFKKSTSAKLNLSTGELSGTVTAVDQLSFTADGDIRAIGTHVSDAAGVAVQAFGLVIPVEDVPATLELTLDDGRIFTMAPAADGSTPSTFTADWEKGNNYIYDIRMLPQGIEIADIQVAGWEDGGITGIPVE